MRPFKLQSKPYIDMFMTWNCWSWPERIPRFNSGNPYTSYAIGPIRIRKFWR